MKPLDCTAARRRLGLTQAGMADALGLERIQTVREYEFGREPKGPVRALYRLILDERFSTENLRAFFEERETDLQPGD